MKSKFIDCRISAFAYIDYPRPNFLFIDLDGDNTNSDILLEEKLRITLSYINKKLNGYPTILWSGNGYHIYQPIECPSQLGKMKVFKEVDHPDNQFLRFGKDYLSGSHADKNNNPSLKSCLLRIPGSINSKSLNNGQDYD